MSFLLNLKLISYQHLKECGEYKLAMFIKFKNKHLKKGGYNAAVEEASNNMKFQRANVVAKINLDRQILAKHQMHIQQQILKI